MIKKRLFFYLIPISIFSFFGASAFANCPPSWSIKCSAPMGGTECYSRFNLEHNWVGYPLMNSTKKDTGVISFISAVYLSGIKHNDNITCLYHGNKGSIISMGEVSTVRYKRKDLGGQWVPCDLDNKFGIPGHNLCCDGTYFQCQFKY